MASFAPFSLAAIISQTFFEESQCTNYGFPRRHNFLASIMSEVNTVKNISETATDAGVNADVNTIAFTMGYLAATKTPDANQYANKEDGWWTEWNGPDVDLTLDEKVERAASIAEEVTKDLVSRREPCVFCSSLQASDSPTVLCIIKICTDVFHRKCPCVLRAGGAEGSVRQRPAPGGLRRFRAVRPHAHRPGFAAFHERQQADECRRQVRLLRGGLLRVDEQQNGRRHRENPYLRPLHD